jgi:hypothetical protein
VETPAEYADRLRHSGVEACASTINALVDLAVLVELASYGASPCTAREVDEARRLAHQVRGSTRRARAAGRFADRRGSLVGVGATSSADGGTVVP